MLQVHVVNLYRAGIAADAGLVERKDKTVRPGIREAREPQAKAGAHASSERNQSACPCRRLAFWHDDFTASNVSVDPSELQVPTTNTASGLTPLASQTA